MSERGTTPVIPSKSNRKVQIDHDRVIYRQHNVIERMFCRFKNWRRIATRFDRNIKTFMAAIAIAMTASMLRWARSARMASASYPLSARSALGVCSGMEIRASWALQSAASPTVRWKASGRPRPSARQ